MKVKEQDLQGLIHINKPKSQENNLEGLALNDSNLTF